MTEYNSWCYSKQYNDENSFQQKRYRFFNKEVGEKRYRELSKLVNLIIKFDSNKTLQENYNAITQEQWSNMLAIPEATDFKEGFEYISGCKIELFSLSGKEVTVTLDGKTYTAVIK